MQKQLHTPFDTLNDHEFGRAGMELPGYASHMMAPATGGMSANDDDAYIDLAQRVREVGEW